MQQHCSGGGSCQEWHSIYAVHHLRLVSKYMQFMGEILHKTVCLYVFCIVHGTSLRKCTNYAHTTCMQRCSHVHVAYRGYQTIWVLQGTLDHMGLTGDIGPHGSYRGHWTTCGLLGIWDQMQNVISTILGSCLCPTQIYINSTCH